jgi:hypothetical protein
LLHPIGTARQLQELTAPGPETRWPRPVASG